jgi:hypothetical protein
MQKGTKYTALIVALIIIGGGIIAYSAAMAKDGEPFFAPLQQLFTGSPYTVPSPDVTPMPTVTPLGTPQAQGTGVIAGHLDIGPLCPVERDPPDPGCQPGPAQYNQYKMVAYDASRKNVIKEASFDAQGNYRIELPAGSYVVDISPHASTRIGGASGVPQTIDLKNGATVTVNVTIDTGIR